MSARRLLFWCHLTAGLLIGIVLLFLSITGTLLSFQTQITNWSERSIHPPAASSACLSPAAAIATAGQAIGQSPINVTLFADAHSPALYTVDNETVYLVDPCSGALLQPTPSAARAFFSRVKDLHRWVAFRGQKHETLRSIKDAANLLFLFMIASGLILWVPRRWGWPNVKAVTLVRPRLQGRAREWNLHNVAGLWFAVPLLLISLTGTIMAYGWASDLLYKLSGSQPPKAAEERPASAASADFTGLDSLITNAEAKDAQWKSMTIRVPRTADKSVSFTIDDRLDTQPSGRNLLTLSRQGKVTRWEPFAELPKGRRWRLYARFLHSGELFGVPGQVVALLSALTLLLLIWTGTALALRRLLAWRKRSVRSGRTSQEVAA